MTKAEVVQQFEALEFFYGKNYNSKAIEHLMPEFEQLPLSAMLKAVDAICQHPYFPGPGQVLKEARGLQHNLDYDSRKAKEQEREMEWEKTKLVNAPMARETAAATSSINIRTSMNWRVSILYQWTL